MLIEQLKTMCISLGAKRVKIAESKQEIDNLWKARRAISPALFQYGPDKINEDIVVPRSKIPDMVRKINSLKEETGLTMVNKTELKKAEYAIDVLFDYTLKLGGTISGEHGVGITKAAYIAKEIGSVELNLMKKIKKVFDPKGILNPGKIFPS